MKEKVLICAIACLLCCGAIARADTAKDSPKKESPAAKEQMPQGKEMFQRRIERLNKMLGLSDEQAKKMKELHDSRAGKMKELRDGIREKREAAIEELKKSDYSADKVRALHAEAQKLEAELDKNRIEGMLETRKILTDQQFKKLIDKFRPPHEEMGEPGTGGPGMHKGRKGPHKESAGMPGPQDDEDQGDMPPPQHEEKK